MIQDVRSRYVETQLTAFIPSPVSLYTAAVLVSDPFEQARGIVGVSFETHYNGS